MITLSCISSPAKSARIRVAVMFWSRDRVLHMHAGEIFIVSDHHFGQKSFLLSKDGRPAMRDFPSVEEMNETLVDRHNSVVTPNDKVYFLGDVALNKKYLPVLSRMNGKKKLIMGNHDIYGAKEYLKYFYDVCAFRVFTADRIVLSHVPIHESELGGRWAANIHGHLHREIVNDNRYFCACVEQLDYTPINYELIKTIFNIRGVL